MTDTAAPTRLKITYATLRNDNEELHALFDRGIEQARAQLGEHHPNYIGGEARTGDSEFEDRSPIDDSLVLGYFAKGTRQDVKDAIAAPGPPSRAGAARRGRSASGLLRHAADLISERQMELGALMAMEVGKNRLEALGDVEETADLIRYYCDQMEANDGFDRAWATSATTTVHTRSVLRPHGVWAVISPFNFPFALAGGPAAARSWPATRSSSSPAATLPCWA